MKRIVFYTDENGICDIYNYLKVLELKNDKDANINASKIYSYIEVLSSYGVSVGMPIVRHLTGKIWELRPLRHRILFFENKDSYVLLHHFIKDTNKTPNREIEKAKSKMNDYLERFENETKQ